MERDPLAPLSLQPGDPLHRVLAGLAAAEARAALGKEVELEPEAVDRSGHWAFVRGRLRDPGGAALTLQGTAHEAAASAGAASDVVAVLFRNGNSGGGDAGGWQAVDRAILPTDVAWLDWPRRHGAPGRLLGIG